MDEDWEDELVHRKRARQRRGILYGSFLMCLTSAALVGAAMGTTSWLETKASNIALDTASGTFKAGLFGGESDLQAISVEHYVYHTVCMEGKCLYSCADSKEARKEHLELVLLDLLNSTDSCAPAPETRAVSGGRALGGQSPLAVLRRSEQHRADNDTDDLTADHLSPTDGLLSQGLWGATIACLCVGLLFAVLGAVFAVINTATTPVEAISGIPGLIVWNCSAAALLLVAVICWSVQFTTHLSENVLVIESREGWTTKGNEKLGYSFWLVVVAIVVHLANLGLIAFGTYEPKVKEKIQEPDKATNDILLY